MPCWRSTSSRCGMGEKVKLVFVPEKWARRRRTQRCLRKVMLALQTMGLREHPINCKV